MLEETIEETAPCMLAGQMGFLGQRDWTCHMNGEGVDGQGG